MATGTASSVGVHLPHAEVRKDWLDPMATLVSVAVEASNSHLTLLDFQRKSWQVAIDFFIHGVLLFPWYTFKAIFIMLQ